MREMGQKYVFVGKLELKSAMHIGGGQINQRATDKPIVLTPEGDPFIPGSSFKGVFRSSVEKLVGVLKKQTTCFLSERTGNCPTANQNRFNNRRRNHRWNEAKLAKILDQELCATCKLFGSPFSASKIYFDDLSVNEWPEITQVRHGVAIDRDSELARDQLLYDYEVVSVGSTFNMQIVLESPTETDLHLTCIGLNEFRSRMLGVGGMRSRGLGNCQITEITGYKSNLRDINQLQSYLTGTTLKQKMTKIDDMNTFLKLHIDALLKAEKEDENAQATS